MKKKCCSFLISEKTATVHCSFVHTNAQSYTPMQHEVVFYLNMNVFLIQQKVQTTFNLTLAIVLDAD